MGASLLAVAKSIYYLDQVFKDDHDFEKLYGSDESSMVCREVK